MAIYLYMYDIFAPFSRFSDSNENNLDFLEKESSMKEESTMWKPTDVIVESAHFILHLPDNIDVETCPPTPAPPTTPPTTPAPPTSPAPAAIHAQALGKKSNLFLHIWYSLIP